MDIAQKYNFTPQALETLFDEIKRTENYENLFCQLLDSNPDCYKCKNKIEICYKKIGEIFYSSTIEKFKVSCVNCFDGKYRCKCGSVVYRHYLKPHFKTKKHQDYLKNQN